MPVPYADLTNPQTLNLYAMVHDDPETFADLDGHCGGGGSSTGNFLGCLSEAGSAFAFGFAVGIAESPNQTPAGSDTENKPPKQDVATKHRNANNTKNCSHACQLRRQAAWVKLIADTAMFAAILSGGEDEEYAEGLETEYEELEAEADAAEAEETATTTTSPNQMNKQVSRGQAPKSVDRVDTPRTPHEKPHIEFKDGNALNNDGTWKHGGRTLTNAEKEWITQNGWKLPQE